jgi:hypothetical protein
MREPLGVEGAMSIWNDAPKGSKEAFAVLSRCAKFMTTISYEDLGEKIGLPAIGTNKPLGFIRDKVCRDQGLPWLNALAVGKDSWIPGESFIPEGMKLADDPNAQLIWWRGMVLQVHAYPWSTLDLK